MVQLLQILGAVSVLSSGVFAAPTGQRRGQWQEQQQQEHQYAPEANHEQPEHERTTLRQIENVYHNTVEYHETTTRLAQEDHSWGYQPPVADHERPQELIHETEELLEHEPTTTYHYVAPPHETTELREQELHEETTEEHEIVTEHETTTEHHETSTLRQQELHETTSTAAHAWPTYGSGATEYGAGYEDCVSQCMVQHAPPPSLVQPNFDHLAPAEGNGRVHVVMVAPEGAGLKYFPFALNATVGDTVRYVWTTPANHTATLSSSLAICNRSAEAEGREFVSGVRNAATEMQVFDVIVQTEEPQFFYCSVQQHCERGMWGIINPSSEFGGDNTVGSQLNEWVEGNPDLLAAWEYMSESVTGTSAENWGSNINLDSIPEWAYPQVAANVMFTRANFAANPGMLETNLGATTPDGSPVAVVSDLNTLLSNSNIDPNNAPAGGAPTGPAPEPSDLINAVANDSGAMRTSSASIVAAALVGIVGYLLF